MPVGENGTRQGIANFFQRKAQMLHGGRVQLRTPVKLARIESASENGQHVLGSGQPTGLQLCWSSWKVLTTYHDSS